MRSIIPLTAVCALAAVVTASSRSRSTQNSTLSVPALEVEWVRQFGTTGGANDIAMAVFASASGNVYVADTDNHVIRKYVAKENKIIHVAGSGRSGSGSGGAGGPPNALELNQPHGVYVDKSGMLYIADSLNNRVLKIGEF
jgi:hypothetical protein